MFFHISLSKNLIVPPRALGPRLQSTLVTKLHEEVEGTCSGRYGFIITVTSVEHMGMGRVQESTGFVIFPVKFKAIVFKPFKGEVVDGVVTQVTKMGFFADVGPLQVFVSRHMVPEDVVFDAQSNPPCFASTDATVRVEKDTEVRMKIVGTRVDGSEVFAIGSIKEDYLGVIS